MSEKSTESRDPADKHLRKPRRASHPSRQENQLYFARAYSRTAQDAEPLDAKKVKPQETGSPT